MNSQQPPLGQPSANISQYQPNLLYPIHRTSTRQDLGLTNDEALPFQGCDIINAYEISWLDHHGKPQMALAQIRLPCDSPYLIESKSLKLYFNSYNQTVFASPEEVQQTMSHDLSAISGTSASVTLADPESTSFCPWRFVEGQLLDQQTVTCEHYQPEPQLLTTQTQQTNETVYSNLFRCNCPVTNQPDWATLVIHYSGPYIDHANLLRYLVSYRCYQSFHEHCIERIYTDIFNHCQPRELTVQGFFTRRGGIDINPFRSSNRAQPERYHRQIRQ